MGNSGLVIRVNINGYCGSVISCRDYKNGYIAYKSN